MITTSNFIGVKFLTEDFVNIFCGVQKILGVEAGSIIEFQNPLSLHVTIFYLPRDIEKEELLKIAMFLEISQEIKPPLLLQRLTYFGSKEDPKIGYLSLVRNEKLIFLKEKLAEMFPSYKNFAENAFEEYIPHMTFFKIKNLQKFLEKKIIIENYIESEIVKLNKGQLTNGVSLYRVNSEFKPEIQVEYLLNTIHE